MFWDGGGILYFFLILDKVIFFCGGVIGCLFLFVIGKFNIDLVEVGFGLVFFFGDFIFNFIFVCFIIFFLWFISFKVGGFFFFLIIELVFLIFLVLIF